MDKLAETNPELAETLSNLAFFRQKRDEAAKEMKEYQFMYEQTHTYKNFEKWAKTVSEYRNTCERLEKDVRALALEAYRQEQPPEPVGYSIKKFEKVIYDEAKAMAYAIENKVLGWLKLDTKAVEKTAPVFAQSFKLDWVKVEQDPRIYIDSDLSAFLPEPEKAEQKPEQSAEKEATDPDTK
jgi:hypothetical protein